MDRALPQQADQQIRVNGLKIHAQIRGEGEPLLLYSGVWGDVRLWDNLLPHLRGFRTIAFDPPGIGRSQMAAWPLSMPALARLGIAVLDELGIDSAHVLGHVVRRRARAADGDLAPGASAPPGPGLDHVRRLRDAW